MNKVILNTYSCQLIPATKVAYELFKCHDAELQILLFSFPEFHFVDIQFAFAIV